MIALITSAATLRSSYNSRCRLPLNASEHVCPVKWKRSTTSFDYRRYQGILVKALSYVLSLLSSQIWRGGILKLEKINDIEAEMDAHCLRMTNPWSFWYPQLHCTAIKDGIWAFPLKQFLVQYWRTNLSNWIRSSYEYARERHITTACRSWPPPVEWSELEKC